MARADLRSRLDGAGAEEVGGAVGDGWAYGGGARSGPG
jgi:hypothetical protein